MIRVYGTTTFDVKKASKQTRINELSNLIRDMNSIDFIGTEFKITLNSVEFRVRVEFDIPIF
jgi:hypothetical protein